MKLIEIKNVSIGYDKKNNIIDNLSLDINKGEFVSIIGPNGSGKSTLLKSIARLLKPNSGTITYTDTNIYKAQSKQYSRLVSFVPQISEYPTDVTIYEFVKMGRFPYSSMGILGNKDDETKIYEALKHTNLLELKDKYIDELSGGQKQRALLALSLAQDTETILLDEPTNHLDIKNQLEIIHLLHELNHTMNKTVILVIHDINHALKFSDKVVIMNKGKIIAHGTNKEVITKEIIKEVFEVNADIIESQNKKIISDYWIDTLSQLSTYHNGENNDNNSNSKQYTEKLVEQENIVDKVKNIIFKKDVETY